MQIDGRLIILKPPIARQLGETQVGEGEPPQEYLNPVRGTGCSCRTFEASASFPGPHALAFFSLQGEMSSKGAREPQIRGSTEEPGPCEVNLCSICVSWYRFRRFEL